LPLSSLFSKKFKTIMYSNLYMIMVWLIIDWTFLGGSIAKSMKFLIGCLSLMFSFYILHQFKRTSQKSSFNEIDEQQFIQFLKQYDGNFLSHLFFLKDKQLYRAQDGQVFIIYQKLANKLIVLGDPIGNRDKIKGAIKEFEQYSKKSRCTPVYYQIDQQFLSDYEEFGYRFFKLGEEARVHLPEFSLEGKKGAKLRTRRNKFFRNGFEFQVVKPPYSHSFLAELKQVSDSWLDGRKEKGFSVSFFDKDYISLFPTAVLRDSSGKIVSFATLASDYRKKNSTITIDLMRHIANHPHGTMDVLFTSIFYWAKEQGYEWCSLGMAPLANVGNDSECSMSEKIARFAFLYGNKFYKFKGLKEYKGKFAHTWEPKYLAYKRSSLPIILSSIIFLIQYAKGYRRVDLRKKTEKARKAG
jgi:phosphatidylglycerol lysyltransferase